MSLFISLPPHSTSLTRPSTFAFVQVEILIYKGKAHTSRCNREQVTYGDLERLFPRQWANDEIINYYGTMIQDASDARVAAAAKGDKLEDEPLSLHYFSTFFFAKLESPGYEKAKLSRWTKKVSRLSSFSSVCWVKSFQEEMSRN